MHSETNNSFKIFSGNSNRKLANDTCEQLAKEVSNAKVKSFSDGELQIEINENVRGQDIFILQSISKPCNDNLMEILLLSDALRRASANKIFAVVPYYGYARQDRRPLSTRVPISARLIADLMSHSGVDAVITLDLHAEQIQGFFTNPVDNIYTTKHFAEKIKQDFASYFAEQQNASEAICVVSPDVGGVQRARALAKRLNLDLAIIDKRRETANKSEVLNIIGEISGKHCIIFDDIVDTAGTLTNTANALLQAGALSVRAYVTHPVLSGNAQKNIEESGLEALVVSDSIPLSESLQACKKIEVISVASLLADAIGRVMSKNSLSKLYF